MAKPMTVAGVQKQLSSRWLSVGSAWRPLAWMAVLAAIQVAGTHLAAAHEQFHRQPLNALAIVLLVAGPAILIARHRYPLPALWGVVGITLAYLLLNYPYGLFVLSVIVALYSVVLDGHRLAAWLSAAALYGGCFGLGSLFGLESPATLGALVGVGAWLLVVLAGSEVARARSESAREAARLQEQEAGRRRSEERLRIARELHDVLAHHISLINIQAGVALHLMDRHPEQATTALTAIEGASREALAELRSVLDILQQPEEGAPRAPAPGLARLDGLTSQAQAAGLDIHTEIEGRARPLPAPVDAAAFRIVQEALTNVIRHAGAASTSVRVCYGERALVLQIDDDGKGAGQAPARGGGNGIPGMRERAGALGGQFEAGPLPGHGFRVRAELPLKGTS